MNRHYLFDYIELDFMIGIYWSNKLRNQNVQIDKPYIIY